MSLPEVPESKLLGYRFKEYSFENLPSFIEELRRKQTSAPCVGFLKDIGIDMRRGSTSKETFFILLKTKGGTLDYVKRSPVTKRDYEKLLKTLNEFSRTLNDEEISLHIAIFDNKKDKAEIKKMVKCFNLYEQTKEDGILGKISHFLWQKAFLIFSLSFTFLMLIVIKEFSSVGIFPFLLSSETLLIILQNFFLYLLIGLSIPMVLYIISLFPSLNEISKKSNDRLAPVKFIINLCLISFVFFTLLLAYDKDLGFKKGVVKEYVLQTRTPALETLYFKEDSNSSLVLTMGTDAHFLYYLENKLIKEKLKDKRDKVCKEEGDYVNFLTDLLYTIKPNLQWYSRVKLSDITIDPKMPDYKEAFCE